MTRQEKKLSLESVLQKLRTQTTVTVPEAGYALGALSRNASYKAAADNVLGGLPILNVGGLKKVPSIFVLRALGLVAMEKKDEPMVQRIHLDEDQFKTLVAGQIVRIGNIELALADIGWDRMIVAINSAMTDADYGNKIVGAMKSTINDHGPITKDLIPSVMKRFRGLTAD